MKSRARYALTIAAASLGAVTFASSARADSWTVMVYMEADNTLNSFAQETFRELQQIGSRKGLHIVVEVDPGPGGIGVDGVEPGGVQRLTVFKDRIDQDANLGQVDMTSGDALASFVKYGVEKDSDNNALILWDHGAGWHGCCEAEHPSTRFMSMQGIADGIKQGLARTGLNKLDIIGFDECLMGNLEVAKALEGSADWLVASEEVEPGEGWDYAPFLKAIKGDASMSTFDVAKVMVDAYAANVEASSGMPAYTMSVFDMSKLGPLVDSTRKLGKQLNKIDASSDDWTAVSDARDKSDEFGEAEKDSYGLIDLGQFAKSTRKIDSVDAAADVLAAVDDAVPYRVQGAMHAKTRGVSIYLPRHDLDDGYGDVAESDKWSAFIGKYTSSAQSDTAGPNLDDVSVSNDDGTSSANDKGRAMVTGNVKGKDTATVTVVLAEDIAGDDVFYGELPIEIGTDGHVAYDWNGSWPVVNDGTLSRPEPLFFVSGYEKDGKRRAELSMPADADLDGSGSYATPASLVFDVDLTTNTGKLVGAFDQPPPGSGKKKKGLSTGALRVDDGKARVRPYHVSVKPTGGYAYAAGTDTFLGKGLTISPKGPEDGHTYKVGLHAKDFAGNATTKLVPVAALMDQLGVGKTTKSGCACKRAGGKSCALSDERAPSWDAPWAIGLGAIAIALARRATRRG